MPPRHAYWTILIDDKPTAFRAREREELQPTFVQLQRKNANVTMQWFARGKLWASREAEREDFQTQRHAAAAPRERKAERPEGAERRGSDWRPGGAHKDPRDRFKKKNRPERAWSEKDPATQRDRDKPGYVAKPRPEWRDKPAGPPRGDRPWQDKKPGVAQAFRPAGGERKPWRDKPAGPPRERKPWSDKPAPPNDRPWQTKPTGPRAQRKPWVGKPGPAGEGAGFKPRGDRPWASKPAGEKRPWTGKPSGDKRPWSPRPPDRSGPPRGDRPPAHRSSSDRPRSDGGWTGKPAGGAPRGDRPWSNTPAGGPPRGDRPPSGERRPWTGKPRSDKPGGFSGPPRGDRPPAHRSPSSRRPGEGERKRRDDED